MIGVSGTNGSAALGVFLGARSVPVAVAVDVLTSGLACGPAGDGASPDRRQERAEADKDVARTARSEHRARA
ncbi:hypothetical protein DAEQUDRAFT_219436 [Daedalea quercina L-15889]|uniref:Uncharacterized protein n=1 Tax=Daedalea quercina L-15889 TaxID=1314783 RepID=A0A165R660_9APHY|nr:hypothetical protein DAEQUDRAFT_219436 [Daedalea quercina L-15889]